MEDLLAMGFDQASVQSAFSRANGDVDQAIELLLSSTSEAPLTTGNETRVHNTVRELSFIILYFILYF